MRAFFYIFLVTFFVVMPQSSIARPATLPISVPFDFQNNQIFVKVGINNARPMWFILDSGASGCAVDKSIARRLKLKTGGSARGTGGGKGTYQITFVSDTVFRLPGVQLEVPRSYVIDLSGQTALQGRVVAGILGYEFFARYVVRLDFESSVLTLYPPEGYSSSGDIIPFTLVKKTPHISALIKAGVDNAVEHQLLVDTGSGSGVDDDAFENASERLEVISGVGLGQEFRATLGRAQWIQIGSFKLAGPIGSTGGVPLVGLEVLRRFDVVLDYSQSRLILSPNRDFTEPFLMDASGLDLRWTPDLKHFAVHDVAKDTPASDADIKIGDVIDAIDGQPAGLFRVDQVQHMLTKDGRTIRLDIRTGRSLRTVTLMLRKRL